MRNFFASDGWTNGSCFNCGWYKENTSFNGGVLNLTIDKDHSGKYAYSGAEYRTNGYYKYGYYETSMQAIKNDGVVSSFFTYTGPSENNPWDEIDIEVLGKDTTKVQFNYYTNGVGNHEYMYDLALMPPRASTPTALTGRRIISPGMWTVRRYTPLTAICPPPPARS